MCGPIVLRAISVHTQATSGAARGFCVRELGTDTGGSPGE